MRDKLRETCLTLVDLSPWTLFVFGMAAALTFLIGYPATGYALIWTGSGLVLGPVVILVTCFWKDGPGRAA